MKVRKLSVENVEGGTLVQVGVFVAHNEEFEASDALVLVDTVRELQERTGVSVNEDQPVKAERKARRGRSTEDKADAEKTDEDTAPASTEGRRSRRGKRSEEGEGSDDKPARRSRRRGASDSGEVADAGEEKPAGRRSRRGRNADTSEGPADEEKPADEKPARRARRSGKASEPVGVTDEDLTAAASEAAAEIGPELVQEILEDDHKVKTLNELPQDQREKFLATLRKEIDAQGEA